MKHINYIPYEIQISGIKEDLRVLNFEGVEVLNKPYHYKINFISSKSDLDLNSLIFNKVTLKISSAHNRDDIFFVNGICESIETKGFFLDQFVYEIILVPRLFKLTLQQSCKVHLDISIPELIQLYMKGNNFNEKLDYELQLGEEYKKLEFVCQYNESDLNFIIRWLEVYGIYYYFVNDENGEKVIFTDNNSSHSKIKHSELFYSNNDYQMQDNKDINIFEFTLKSKAVNSAYIHDHYDGSRKNISKNSASSTEYKQDMSLRNYGDNPQIQESYANFELLEEQRILANKSQGMGKSSVISMFLGGIFKLNSDFSAINTRYLIKKLSHKGDQTQLLKGKEDQPEIKLYENEFEVIPYDMQYRPNKLSSKVYCYGVLNGTIDAISEDKPLVDKLGRYKVVLPFDTLQKEDGKHSIPMRVVQPSASNEKSGTHFKLLKGDEVIIAFLEGDIDRPVILGAVNNTGQVSLDDFTDKIKRTNSSIAFDDNYIKTITPQKIEIIGI